MIVLSPRTKPFLENIDKENEEEYDNEPSDDKECSWQRDDYFDSVWKEYAFVAAGMVAQLLNQAGSTMTLSIMNVLVKELKAQENSESWLMASFPLVSGSFILVSGRIGDIYGLKNTLVGGYLFLIIWSLICGLSSYSNSGTFFIVSRAFQGLGISFILPNVLGLVGNIYKPETRRKNMVISLIGMCAPIGALLGTFFSGLIVVHSEKNWPWAFYAYTIAATLNLFMSYFVIPNNVPTNIHGFSMDWVGAAIGVSGLILFNFVWNQAPVVGWNVSYIIALLVVSVFLLLAFFVFELKGVEIPLLPKAVSCNRSTLMILGSMILGWGSFGIWSFYYFQFVLNLRHYTPLWAGGTYFMFSIWGCIAALTVGFSIKRVGPGLLLFFALIAFDCGSIILSTTPVHQTYFRSCLGAMIILSFGMDLSFPAATIILSDELPMQYQGMAGSLVNTVVNYSMSLFLGIGGTVERYTKKTGSDLLEGYRAALYFAIGSASLGVLISGIFIIKDIWKWQKLKKASKLNNL